MTTARKRKNNIIKILIVFLVIAGIAGYGYYMYHKPVTSLKNQEPDFSISAQQLVADFEENEEHAGKKYSGKVVEVSGVIGSTEKSEKGIYNILINTDNPMSGVSCTVDSTYNQQAARLQSGHQVRIKGYCTGYLSDVVMVRCIPVTGESSQ